MGAVEREFSRAQELLVCHDETRVHGLQLTLKMHRYKYQNEADVIDKYALAQYFDSVDKIVADSTPRKMKFVGTVSPKCDTTVIFKYGSVKDIVVYSDASGVRSLSMQLTNGMRFNYGATAHSSNFRSKKFSFEQGKQLVGIHGTVSPQSLNLMTLGFFRAECSDTMQLYMTAPKQQVYIKEVAKSVERETQQEY